MTARYTALAILDLGWIAVSLQGGLGVAAALLGHAALTLWTCVIWLRSDPHGGFAAAVLGLAGPVGVMLGQKLGRIADRRAGRPSFDPVAGTERHGARRKGAALEMARLLDGRVHYPAPEGLDSLVAVLRHGSVAARRRALETVVRAFEPGLSPLVARMLDDPDQTIRALAAAASARITQNLAEQRAALEARIAAGDEAAVEILGHLLAEHGCANHLLSDTQRQKLRDDAARLLDRQGLGQDAARLAVEAAWRARDYAAIDRIHAASSGPEDEDDMAPWWRAEAVR
ncbi:hypothetical protein [Sphingomonas sp. Marseille-Q8236]